MKTSVAMKKNFCVLLLLIASVALNSCKKDPGQGGNSSIIGYVHLTVMDIVNDTLASQDGFDRDVFIVYGDDISFGDRTRTGSDGKFEFKYLRKGKYRVYVYSEDNDPIGVYNPDSVIAKSVEITSKKQTVNAGTFQIRVFK